MVEYVAGLSDAWLSVLTLHELRFGLANLPEGKRRRDLAETLHTMLEHYADRILVVDASVSERAADLRHQAQRRGRVLHLADALIAGTALANRLTLATRNVSDFEGLELSLANPWR